MIEITAKSDSANVNSPYSKCRFLEKKKLPSHHRSFNLLFTPTSRQCESLSNIKCSIMTFVWKIWPHLSVPHWWIFGTYPVFLFLQTMLHKLWLNLCVQPSLFPWSQFQEVEFQGGFRLGTILWFLVPVTKLPSRKIIVSSFLTKREREWLFPCIITNTGFYHFCPSIRNFLEQGDLFYLSDSTGTPRGQGREVLTVPFTCSSHA